MKRAENFVTLEPPRQPLRIPGGWRVEINELMEVDPSQLSGGDPHWYFLSQDLLHARSIHRDLTLDVGWYPERDPEGCFRLILSRNGDDEGHSPREFRIRVLSELAQKIDEVLREPLLESSMRQPLRIPGGWRIMTHELTEVDPSQLSLEDPRWRFFSENLLLAHAVHLDLTLDLGWYPGGQPEGGFRLTLLRNDNWGDPLRAFSTRELPELVQKLDEWLGKPPRKPSRR